MKIINSPNKNEIFRKFDANRDGSISADEVKEQGKLSFIADFVMANPVTQRAILQKMTQDGRWELYGRLVSNYRAALNGKAKEAYKNAMLPVSASIILNNGPCNNRNDLIINTLTFMNKAVAYWEIDDFQPGRDACEFDAMQVLAEGNFNGCVEAAKLFLALFNEASEQSGGRFGKATYVSSFNVDRAPQMNLTEGPAGHAIIEIQNDSGTVYVDPSIFPEVGPYGQRLTNEQLENDGFLINVRSDSTYSMMIEGGEERFKLFGRGVLYDRQENPKNPMDPKTSNGATRLAIGAYLISLFVRWAH